MYSYVQFLDSITMYYHDWIYDKANTSFHLWAEPVLSLLKGLLCEIILTSDFLGTPVR